MRERKHTFETTAQSINNDAVLSVHISCVQLNRLMICKLSGREWTWKLMKITAHGDLSALYNSFSCSRVAGLCVKDPRSSFSQCWSRGLSFPSQALPSSILYQISSRSGGCCALPRTSFLRNPLVYSWVLHSSIPSVICALTLFTHTVCPTALLRHCEASGFNHFFFIFEQIII